MRVPSWVLYDFPIAFDAEPKILRANSWFTTATRGAFLSSCQVKVLPETSAVPAAWKYSGDMLNRNGVATALDGLRSVISSLKTGASSPAPLNGTQSINPTDSTPGI